MSEEHVRGARELIARLWAIARELPKIAANALREEAEIERDESMKRTPVEYGTLKDSHEVHTPKISGDEITCLITVGGAAREYAIYVHENLDVDHPNGQAKFLESTLEESRPYMATRVGRRIERNLPGIR